MRVGSITFCHPLKWALKNHIFANFEKTEKLWKSSEDCGKLANFVRHLNTRVAEGVASDPQDFTADISRETNQIQGVPAISTHF